MIKKNKYLIIVGINSLILTGFLALWTDSFEQTFNNLVRQIEFLKIIGMSILSLIGIRILVSVFRKKRITDLKTKIKLASFLTLFLSSYFYVNYSIKIINNQLINGCERNEIMEKVNSDYMTIKIDSLSYRQYKLIAKGNWHPDISKQAFDINYFYFNDGFLPDYSLNLVYYLPLNSDIKEFSIKKGDYSESQRIEMLSDKMKVIYNQNEK